MSELNQARIEIDKIDKEIVKLLERRVDIVLSIGEYKKNNNINIEDKERENIIFNNIKENINNKSYYSHFLDIFKYILKKSKELQKEI